MSILIEGMKLPQHAAVNGEKDTAYKCVILSHPDSSVELVIDSKFASHYDNGHKIQRYPITEIPTPHGMMIDADRLYNIVEQRYRMSSGVEHRCERNFLDLIVTLQLSSERGVSE